MATVNSAGNLVTMNATGDVARAALKLKVAGVMAVSNSATALPRVKVTDTSGSNCIIPLAVGKSGLLLITKTFRPPLEVTGLKAQSCANVTVTVQLA